MQGSHNSSPRIQVSRRCCPHQTSPVQRTLMRALLCTALARLPLTTLVQAIDDMAVASRHKQPRC